VAKAVEEAQDDFFTPEIDTGSKSAPQGKAAKPQGPPAASSTGPATQLVPFATLKDRLKYHTLQAVTFRPFNLTAMSEVQRRVLSLMPELAGGKMTAEAIARETPEETKAREAREKAGRQDLLVKAKTGTGKTLAFLLPSIDARLYNIEQKASEPDEDGNEPTPSRKGLTRRSWTRESVGTVVISPTRELATQIANEALKLQTWYKEMQVQLLVGGANRSEQIKKFKSIRWGRKDVVVATPGRLVDLLSEPVVADALATADMLVLDEADTLLEMGFARDLNRIVDALPKDRQTFLFSATVSPEIAQVARKFLKPNHTLIDCVPKNESNVHLHIPQYATVLESPEQQLSHVVRLISQDQLVNDNSKVIVFLPTTKQTMLFATLLREMSQSLPQGLSVHEIHSRLDQNRRSRAAERFRNDRRPSVLVTSDVSARGVDYPGVTRVIQVGIPSSTDQYIHRVGRTGRGSAKHGRGDIVLQPFEATFVQELEAANVPFKTFSAQELVDEVNTLVEGDERTAERIHGIDNKAAAVPPMLDPEAIREVYTSLIGYYLAKTDVLRQTAHSVYRGLQAWSTGAAGLHEPPHLSQSFLSKFGLDKPERAGKFTPSKGRSGGRQGPPPRKTFGMRSRDDDGEGYRPRSNSFDRNDRGDRDFRPRREGSDGFRPRSQSADGFRPRGDRPDGFRPRNDRGDRPDGFRPRRDSDSYAPRRDRDGPRPPRRDSGSNPWDPRNDRD
jgi:ATP-dependent RNA helicase MSS116